MFVVQANTCLHYPANISFLPFILYLPILFQILPFRVKMCPPYAITNDNLK